MRVAPRSMNTQRANYRSLFGSAHRPPRVWVMLSAREGDNAQVLALAEALGWPVEVRRFENRPGALVANLLLGPTLRSLVRGESSVIRPPWPDLVIAAGTQSEPVCRRIRHQAERDGRRVRLIFLGRPWGKPHHYDLVVPTPQYQVPHGP